MSYRSDIDDWLPGEQINHGFVQGVNWEMPSLGSRLSLWDSATQYVPASNANIDIHLSFSSGIRFLRSDGSDNTDRERHYEADLQPWKASLTHYKPGYEAQGDELIATTSTSGNTTTAVVLNSWNWPADVAVGDIIRLVDDPNHPNTELEIATINSGTRTITWDPGDALANAVGAGVKVQIVKQYTVSTGGTQSIQFNPGLSLQDDDLTGCFLVIQSGTHADTYIPISDHTHAAGVSTITWDAALSSAVGTGVKFRIGDRVVLAYDDTLKTSEYVGYSATWPAHQQKLVHAQYDAYGNGMTYNYDPDYFSTTGRCSKAVTTNGYEIDYTYITDTNDPNIGRLAKVEVSNPSDQVIQKAEYWYQGSDADYECGTDGDLILVKVSKRGSADDLSGSTFSIQKYSHYRYYTDEFNASPPTEDGVKHQLMMIVENDNFQRLMADKPSLSVEDILKLGAGENGGAGDNVEDYASRAFTYYVDAVDTSNVTTPWWGGAEDLTDKYGSSTTQTAKTFSNLNEVGMVKEETIYSGCGGCGGGPSGSPIRHTFYYLGDSIQQVTAASGSTAQGGGAAVRSRLVVQDTMASSGTAYDVKMHRSIFTVSSAFQLLEAVRAEDTGSGILYWGRRNTYESTGGARKVGQLQSSSSALSWSSALTDNNAVEEFASGFLTLSGGDVMSYTYNADGYRVGSLVAEGTGTAYLTGYTEWGDGTSDQPKHLPVARYRYAEKKTLANYTQGDKTTYTYTFWDDDDTQIKTRKTTYPIVTTGENGSGSASVMWEYFDTKGRLRWVKDANGRTNYRSYHPLTGKLAYLAVDVDTSGLSAEIENGSSGLWVAWDNADSGNDNSVPTDLQSSGSDYLTLVTKREFDDLGRVVKSVSPEGAVTYTAYGDDIRMVFPHWDAATDEPLLPIRVTETDEGGRVTEVYSVDPASAAIQLDGSVPVGFSTEPSQSLYSAWTVNTYNVGGQLVFTDQYFNIPASGTGNASDHYYRTAVRYDGLGRREYVIQAVSGSPGSSGVEQVTQYVYDVLDRVSEIKQGVSDENHSITLSYDAIPTTLKTVGKTYFDGADSATPLVVGDSDQTRVETYFADGTTEADRTTVLYHYDFRGRLRGIEPEVAPYTVMDLDWSGRTLATAQFTALPSWTSLTDDYAVATTSGRGTLSTTEYDSWGRSFRSLRHGVVLSTGAKSKAIEYRMFYDAKGQMVAQVTTGSGAMEYAYDGAGRSYQTRKVTMLSGQDGGSYFTSGAFNYQSPAPRPGLGDMTGGDDHVLALDHSDLDDDGKTLSDYHWSAEHDDAGLSASTPDYIQSTVHRWYDDADRIVTSAAYGTNGTGFEYASAPSRPSTPLSSSSDTVLLSEWSYETSTGRLQDVITPLGSGGSATTQTTRTVYDDLGRVVATIENHDDATVTPGSPAVVTGSGGTTTDLDRVTVYAYNGLNQNVVVTAVDPDADGIVSDNQDTLYLYEDLVHAGRLTRTIYPDSADTTSSGFDQVAMSYHLDGTPSTQTKQKASSGDTATVITYDYDAARRPTADRVTTVGTDVDDTVRAMVSVYDDLGRVSSRRTYAQASPVVGTDTPLSDVAFTYGDYGELLTLAQSHDGEVITGDPEVAYGFDTTDAGADGVLDHALRPSGMTYPNGRQVSYDYTGNAGIDALISRPGGIIEETPGTLVLEDDPIVSYEYLGDGTLAVKDYPAASLRMDRYGQTGGTYAGYDRFGRITQQRWETYDGTGTDVAAVFDIAHDYDQASNRLNAVRSVYELASQVYGHDGLNRLTSYEAGEYDSTADAIEDVRSFDRRFWDYDQLGNQRSVESLEDPASPTNPYTASTFNDANEIATRSVQATKRAVSLDDFEDSATASLWEGVSGASFTVDNGGSGLLTTTGTGTNIVLFSEESAGSAALSVRVSSVTADQNAGLVFGYQDASTYYRVVYWRDGTFSLLDNSGVLATTTATGVLHGIVTVSLEITEYGVICRLTERGRGSGFDVAELSYSFPAGSPVGRVGVYANPDTDSTAISFDKFTWTEGARATPLGVAWDNYANNVWINQSTDRLVLDAANLFDTNADVSRRPVLLRGVHGDRFRVDFATVQTSDVTQKFRFHFNAQSPEDSDYLVIPMVDGSGQGEAPSGYEVARGAPPTILSATETDANTVDWTASATVWIRVESDGTDLTVYQATTEAGLNTATACYETSGSTDQFVMSGGRVGFAVDTGFPEVAQVKVYLDLNADGDFADANELQHDDDFTLDANGYEQITVENDAAGNLTYDGVFRYVYDAWNRLIEVRKAVSSTVDGATIVSYRYDGLGQRITRSLQHRGDATITYHDYWSSGWQLLETHDASANVLKQHLWGLNYIDELIQVAVNRDVYIDITEDQCEQVYFALQDAHYNVIGLATAKGHLVERYEYTPYGERKIYSQPQALGDFNGDGVVGSADLGIMLSQEGESTGEGDELMYLGVDGDGEIGDAEYDAILYSWGAGTAEGDLVTRGMSRAARVENRDGLLSFAICDVGHQGLYHDEESRLVYNRARQLNADLGRWEGRDPLNFVDGSNLYQYERSRPTFHVDPSGRVTMPLPEDYQRFEQLKCIQSKLRDFIKNRKKYPSKVQDIFDQINPNFDNDWNNYVENRGQYFDAHYAERGAWETLRGMGTVLGANGLNLPFRKPMIDNHHYWNDDPIDVIDTLLHEPMHDMNQEGFGHGEPFEKLSNVLRDGRNLASLTPRSGKCKDCPNKGKSINTMLEEIYCACKHKY